MLFGLKETCDRNPVVGFVRQVGFPYTIAAIKVHRGEKDALLSIDHALAPFARPPSGPIGGPRTPTAVGGIRAACTFKWHLIQAHGMGIVTVAIGHGLQQEGFETASGDAAQVGAHVVLGGIHLVVLHVQLGSGIHAHGVIHGNESLGRIPPEHAALRDDGTRGHAAHGLEYGLRKVECIEPERSILNRTLEIRSGGFRESPHPRVISRFHHARADIRQKEGPGLGDILGIRELGGIALIGDEDLVALRKPQPVI